MICMLQTYTANDSERTTHNSNNNNIFKYLKLKNDRILHLSEKNYNNLIVVLTNNAVDISAASYSSSNSTLSLTSGSSAFLNLLDQNNTYRKEESEILCDSKRDIAE